MLNELTALKLDAALLQLEIEQRSGGDAPAPGQLTQAELARRAGVTKSTIHQFERIAAAKLARGLLDQDLPPRLAKRLIAHFDSKHPDQPDLL